MSENLEHIEAGKIYHIYNHAIGESLLFREETNYLYFTSLMEKYLMPVAQIYAYCLLPNHFHICLRFNTAGNSAENKNMYSQKLSNLFNAYTQAYNKKYVRRGSLFMSRFCRKSVENEDSLRNLILYINTNDVHHNINSGSGTWKYSSYNSYFSAAHDFVDKDFVINLFDNIENFTCCINQKIEMEENLRLE